MEDGKTSFKAGSGQGRVGRGLVRGSEGRYTVATSPLNFGFSRERPPLSQSARLKFKILFSCSVKFV